MQERIRVSFFGNCIDRGTGVASGGSFADLVEASIRRRNVGVDVSFEHRTVPHPSLLDSEVERALTRKTDVVVIGAFTQAVRGPVALNPLWGNERFREAVAFVHAIDRRVANDPSLRRKFDRVLRSNHPLRKKVGQVSIDVLRTQLSEAISRLQKHRVGVVLRGPMSRAIRESRMDDNGENALYEELSVRFAVPVVLGLEVLSGPVGSYMADARRMSQDGHRLFAQALEGYVAGAVQEAVRRRVAGGRAPDRVAQALRGSLTEA